MCSIHRRWWSMWCVKIDSEPKNLFVNNLVIYENIHRKSSLLKTTFHVPNRDTMRSNIKISDRIVHRVLLIAR